MKSILFILSNDIIGACNAKRYLPNIKRINNLNSSSPMLPNPLLIPTTQDPLMPITAKTRRTKLLGRIFKLTPAQLLPICVVAIELVIVAGVVNVQLDITQELVEPGGLVVGPVEGATRTPGVPLDAAGVGAAVGGPVVVLVGRHAGAEGGAAVGVGGLGDPEVGGVGEGEEEGGGDEEARGVVRKCMVL